MKDDVVERGLDCLSARDNQRYHRFLHWQDAQAMMLGRLLLRFGLRQHNSDISIAQDIIGADFSKPAFANAGYQFSISHSFPWVVCALSANTAVGIDIEIPRQSIELDDFSMMFCSAEIAYMRTLKGDELVERFYWLWTRKEAVLKLAGDGLSGQLRQLNCLSDKTTYRGQAVELAKIGLPGELEYSAHLAVYGAMPELDIRVVELVRLV